MARNDLAVAPGFRLPFDAVTQKFAWVGNSGSGKTYGAKVMAEEMLRVGAQVVAIDPVDAWYGLRYGRTKGRSGLPIYVFGGSHGDAPLEATAGKLLADVVVEQGISAVLSLRHLPKAKQRKFVADFCEQLYLRKGEDKYRTAIHVFVDEAHQFAPQNIASNEADASRCLGALIDIGTLGRGSGLGISLVTQRVASVSKAILELVEVMVAFRTTGPLSRKKFKEWFDAQDAEDHLKEFSDAVLRLREGHAWVWSPSFLDLFQEVAIRQAETFDSSATPKAGKARPRPAGRAAALDLTALGERIKETIEHAEANDPKKLHAEITRLQRELAKKPVAAPAGTKVEEVRVEIEVPTVPPEVDEVLEYINEALRSLGAALQPAQGLLKRAGAAAVKAKRAKPKKTASPVAKSPSITTSKKPIEYAPIEYAPAERATRTLPVRAIPAELDGVSKQGMGMLTTLAKRHPMALTMQQWSTMSGYKRSSSSWDKTRRALREMGLVEERNGQAYISEATLNALGVEPEMGSTLDMWCSKLPKQAAEFLRFIYEADTTTKDDIGDAFPQYSRTSSGWDKNLRTLKINGLIEINGEDVSINSVAF